MSGYWGKVSVLPAFQMRPMIYLQIHFQNIIPCSSMVNPKPTNHLRCIHKEQEEAITKTSCLSLHPSLPSSPCVLPSLLPSLPFPSSPLLSHRFSRCSTGWPYTCSCLHLLHAGIPGVHQQDQQSFLFLNDLLFKMADWKDRKHVTVKLLEWPTPSVRLTEQACTSLDSSDYALVWSILPYLINKLITVDGW